MLKEITIEEAKNKSLLLKHFLVREISNQYIGKASDIDKIAWDEVQEFFSFDDNCQIHIFDYDGGLKAVYLCDADVSEDIHHLDQKYLLNRQYDGYRYVVIREYLDSDEDGQNYVCGKRILSFA